MAEQRGEKHDFQSTSKAKESKQSSKQGKKRKAWKDNTGYWQTIKKKGKTNVTVQRQCLQLRADTLYEQHSYDIVVLFHSCKPGRIRDRHIIDHYATPGKAREFMGGLENVQPNSNGGTIYRAYKAFFQDYADTHDALPVVGTPNETSVDGTPNVASVDGTPNVASVHGTPNRPNVPSVHGTPNRPNVASVHGTPNRPNVASVDGTPNETSVDGTPNVVPVDEMIVYMVNGAILAAGYIDLHRNILHGTEVPSDHVCMLTTTAQHVKAPFLAGDTEENYFLERGKFFALPKALLYRASLKQDKSVQLVPFLLK